MKKAALQAHRGVSTDFPENTMSAFVGAYEQGYPIIELDPAVTKDGVIVILHDKTLSRTARTADGEKLEQEIFINEITYEEALSYDYGLWFDERFRGEKIPLLSQALQFAKEHDILIKIDNKFEHFSEQAIQKIFDTVKEIGARTGFTCTNLDLIRRIRKEIPDAQIHYDGVITEEILQELTTVVPNEQLVVWLPYESPITSWVRIAFVDEELAALVHKYATLGIWILQTQEQYDDAVTRFGADIIETTGGIKPADNS